jgi:hypothetical protein
VARILEPESNSPCRNFSAEHAGQSIDSSVRVGRGNINWLSGHESEKTKEARRKN